MPQPPNLVFFVLLCHVFCHWIFRNVQGWRRKAMRSSRSKWSKPKSSQIPATRLRFLTRSCLFFWITIIFGACRDLEWKNVVNEILVRKERDLELGGKESRQVHLRTRSSLVTFSALSRFVSIVYSSLLMAATGHPAAKDGNSLWTYFIWCRIVTVVSGVGETDRRYEEISIEGVSPKQRKTLQLSFEDSEIGRNCHSSTREAW